jgi:S1-C subfamily serine protease
LPNPPAEFAVFYNTRLSSKEEYEMKNRVRTLTKLAAGLAITALTAAGATISIAADASVSSAAQAVKTERAADESSVSKGTENSVVRVFATLQNPDLSRPWSKLPVREITGSGMVIEGRRILTNAHVVLYASQVQIQGNRSGDKLSAAVEAIAPGIDLAVLKLDDESFFDTHAALPLADSLPEVKDPVMVYGFPTGGNNLSITKGIVSRIDFSHYNYSVFGLRVQIDAAINPGNSGGPAVVGDKVVGIAFSVLANSQNIGYIIPSEEIRLFLHDIADGHYGGKPGIFDEFQTLENPALRAFLKLDKSVEGIVVRAPFRTDSGYPLKQWDVITKIGDSPVDNQGNIMVRDNLKLAFSSYAQKIAKDGKIPLSIIRAGREMPVQLPALSFRPRLIPYLKGDYPSYFICGPMVFSVAVAELVTGISRGSGGLRTTNILSHNGNPLFTRRGDRPAFDGEELVVVPSPFFAHALAKNYSSPRLMVVENINGITVKNLRHLVEIIRDSKDEFIRIEFAGRGTEVTVFPREELISATEEILNDNGIRSQASSDMLAVWKEKQP